MQELDIKEHFHYDHTDEESIMARARMLEGKTLRFVSENSPYEEEAFKKSNKGNIGNFIEKHWFGYPLSKKTSRDLKKILLSLSPPAPQDPIIFF